MTFMQFDIPFAIERRKFLRKFRDLDLNLQGQKFKK